MITVTTTSDKWDELDSIARSLLNARLAACCQIVGPINSIYRWQDEIQESTEHMCLIKTHESKFDAVKRMIQELHHYDEPEIIATPITAGSEGYLDWMNDCLELT